MDWSKTKNILIVALIATNIFLLFTYITKNEKEASIADMEVLASVLEERNVFVETEIPEYEDKLPAITLTYSDKSEQIVEALRENTYVLDNGPHSGEVAHEEMAVKCLKDCGLYSDDIAFAYVEKEEDGITIARFENMYKDMVIGGSYVDVTFKDGEIVDVSKQFVSVEAASKRKLGIISPEEALLVLMSEKAQEEAVRIAGIELVFWINDSSFESAGLVSDTAFPAWEMTTRDGEVYYIEAYRE